MQSIVRLAALAAVVLTGSACDRVGPPTAADDIRPALGRVGGFKSFRVPTANSQPRHLVLGPDGALWFTESETVGPGAWRRVHPPESASETRRARTA